MFGRHRKRYERNRVNICVLVFSSPLAFINFTSLIHRLLHRKPSSLAQSPFACLSFLLPIPLFLRASNPSASSLTPATCDFLCIVSSSLSFPHLPFHHLFDATLVGSFFNPAAHPNPSPRVAPTVLFNTTN